MIPLSANRPWSVAAMQAAVESEDKTLVIVSQRKPEIEQPSFGDLFEIGTLSDIKRMSRSGDMIQVIVQGN